MPGHSGHNIDTRSTTLALCFSLVLEAPDHADNGGGPCAPTLSGPTNRPDHGT